MNISELIRSTEYVKGFSPKNTFGYKQFGEIYLYNKVVRTKPNSSIVEVSMMISGSTDKVRFGRSFKQKATSVHKVMVSIHGVKQQVVTFEDLVGKIRGGHPELAAIADEDLVQAVTTVELKRDKGQKKLLDDVTVLPQANGTYVIMEDNISKDSEIRVWCSCSSYYWVFQYYNVEHGVDIFGKSPEKYTPKTKRGWEAFQANQPVRNPGRHPGMCKHIMLLLALLMDSDTIAEARGVVGQYRANIDRFQSAQRLTQDGYEKLLKDFKSDYRRLKNKRNQERTEVAGYAQLHKTSSKHVGWNKNLSWNKNTQSWRKVQNNMVGKKKKKK